LVNAIIALKTKALAWAGIFTVAQKHSIHTSFICYCFN